MAAESKTPTIKNKVCLISIDGWGMSAEQKGNAVFHAQHPTIDELLKDHLHSVVEASGLAVGLPEGLMGNSEVGHLTMGSGRVLYQDLTRINLAVKDGSIGTNKALVDAFNTAKQRGSRLHFLGLISDGGVHSHIDHLKALLAEAKKAAVPKTYVHFFADGRDTPPTSATVYIKDLQAYLAQQQYGTLATVTGRYYAMDRDKRWERIAIAYDGLIGGKGQEVKAEDLVSAVEQRYQAKENDEFLKPIIVDKEGTIKDNDVLVFFDFRSDRMRQIVETFGIKPPFEPSVPLPSNLHIVQMTQYNEKWTMPIMFPPQNVDNVLAEWISKANLRQFHTAETEKYAHVTFFFNGGREIVFANEERGLIPSPKVPTYDHKPEMSMDAVADSVVKAIEENNYSFVMCNLAAPDMVGHTGIFDAAVKAVTACDAAISKMWAACKKHGWVLVITADHGNAEEMMDENGAPKTSHTTNPVFLIVGGQDVTNNYEIAHPKGGLRDVAPTVIYLLGLPECKEMTGTSVVKQK